MKKVILLSGLTLMLYVSACRHDEHEKAEETKFLVTSPIQKDTLIFHDYVAQIRSISHIELRSQEKGYLQGIFVDEGQRVHRGQLMFQIMPLLYKAETNKAAAEVSLAEIEYQNTKSLADSHIVSKNELAMAKAKLDKANAELDLAKAHLGFTEIKAPFDGIMGRFNGRLGSLVDEGELLTTLSDNSKMWVYFNVPEAEYLDFITKSKTDSLQKVKLEMANHAIYEKQGVVETIEADFNNETGNIAFRATFPNPKSILRHGETGNILMPFMYPNAVIIPQKATFEILDKKFVFVIDKENRVQSREIRIAAEIPHLYVVKDGLAVTDRILLEGLRKVKNNQKIEFTTAKFSDVLSELNRLHAE